MDPDRFDRWAEAYDSGPELAVVEPFCTPDATVVEVGCGTGRLTRRVAPRVTRHLAIDADADLLAYCRATAPQGVETLRGDGERLPIAPGAADLVLDGWALSAMDVERGVAERLRVAGADGTIALLTEAWDEADRPDSDYVRVVRSLPGSESRPALEPTLWQPIRDAVPPDRSLTERSLTSHYRFDTIAGAVDAFRYHVESYNDGRVDRETVRERVLAEGSIEADGSLVLSEHARAFVV